MRTLLLAALITLAPTVAQAAGGPPINVEEGVGIEGIPPGPKPPEDAVEDLAHHIGTQLRCPVCQGLSVADSTSETAVTLQRRIQELVRMGYTEQQIKDYFLDRYGEFILLEPKKEGINLLIWIGPGLAFGGSIAWAAITAMQWSKEPDEVPLPTDQGRMAKDKYEQQLLAELED